MPRTKLQKKTYETTLLVEQRRGGHPINSKVTILFALKTAKGGHPMDSPGCTCIYTYNIRSRVHKRAAFSALRNNIWAISWWQNWATSGMPILIVFQDGSSLWFKIALLVLRCLFGKVLGPSKHLQLLILLLHVSGATYCCGGQWDTLVRKPHQDSGLGTPRLGHLRFVVVCPWRKVLRQLFSEKTPKLVHFEPLRPLFFGTFGPPK